MSTPGEIELIMRAAAFAAAAHINQRRKAIDQPYINHALRVAHSAAQTELSADAVAAALLHDVVEDTEISLGDLRARFPERVVHLVHLLTKWWPDNAPAELKVAEKPKYYGAILQEPEAVNLKLLDRADNLRDMIQIVPKAPRWARRYLEKTEDEVSPLQQASKNESVLKIYAQAIRNLKLAISEFAQLPG